MRSRRKRGDRIGDTQSLQNAQQRLDRRAFSGLKRIERLAADAGGSRHLLLTEISPQSKLSKSVPEGDGKFLW